MNDFTFPTLDSDSAYTLVERDNNNNVINVIETRDTRETELSFGERDIGVFLFKKEPVFKLLNEDLPNKFNKRNQEHGFLYVIQHLAKKGYKVEALKIAKEIETVSLNSLDDLEDYI